MYVTMKDYGKEDPPPAYLVHHERLDLSLKDLHTSSRNHRADVRNNKLAEYVADEPVIPLEASSGCVLY